MIVPTVDFLDPRPEAEANIDPILSSVNISSESLLERQAELPSKHIPVRVCQGVHGAPEAMAWLTKRGWKAEPSSQWKPGQDTQRGRLWSPSDFLEAWLDRHPGPGTALDLGCGTGRDPVFLASRGWTVLAADRLADNIERGAQLGERYLEPEARGRIHWVQKDVFDANWAPTCACDLVLSFFFFDRRLIRLARRWLRTEGVLLMEAFTERRQGTHGKPTSPDRVIREGEAESLLAGFELQELREAEGPRGHTVRIAARLRS